MISRRLFFVQGITPSLLDGILKSFLRSTDYIFRDIPFLFHSSLAEPESRRRISIYHVPDMLNWIQVWTSGVPIHNRDTDFSGIACNYARSVRMSVALQPHKFRTNERCIWQVAMTSVHALPRIFGPSELAQVHSPNKYGSRSKFPHRTLSSYL